MVGTNGKERTWRKLDGDGNGNFNDPALRGGYGYATVDVPTERVMA